MLAGVGLGVAHVQVEPEGFDSEDVVALAAVAGLVDRAAVVNILAQGVVGGGSFDQIVVAVVETVGWRGLEALLEDGQYPEPNRRKNAVVESGVH